MRRAVWTAHGWPRSESLKGASGTHGW
jgi:hypothetical protein